VVVIRSGGFRALQAAQAIEPISFCLDGLYPHFQDFVQVAFKSPLKERFIELYRARLHRDGQACRGIEASAV
jgi:hypothetical protein